MDFTEPWLGADPEFVFLNTKTGRIQSARTVVRDVDPHNERGEAPAIGLDGNRETASLELRPGISESGEDLVNRCAELLGILHKHYKPKAIAYKAGAWVDPEPLGGHVHIGWKPAEYGTLNYNNRTWQASEILRGLQALNDFAVPDMFDATEMQHRALYVSRDPRIDYGKPLAYRPVGGMHQVISEGHLEYRTPPSWLGTPEAAYCFLGGAEVIAKEVFSSPVGRVHDWPNFVKMMFTDATMSPPGSSRLDRAYQIAVKFPKVQDFDPHWVS